MVESNKIIGSRDSEHDIMLFALSTCIWCRKVKKLLGDLGFSYEFIDVDSLSGQDKSEVMDRVREYNPRSTFPTLVIDDSECIVGFQEDRIKQVLL